MYSMEDIKKMIAFDAFVRKCIKNFSINYEKIERKKWYNNILFFNDESEILNFEIYEDRTDELFAERKIFIVSGIHIEVTGDSIINALETLPMELRQIILLYYFENFTEKKIAQFFNKPEPTIHSKKVRALKLLKEAICKNAK